MAQSTHAIGMCDMRHTEFCRLCKHFDYFVPKNMWTCVWETETETEIRGEKHTHKIREDDDTQALTCSTSLLCCVQLSFHFGFISKFELRNLHDSHMNGVWYSVYVGGYFEMLIVKNFCHFWAELLVTCINSTMAMVVIAFDIFPHRKCTHHSVHSVRSVSFRTLNYAEAIEKSRYLMMMTVQYCTDFQIEMIISLCVVVSISLFLLSIPIIDDHQQCYVEYKALFHLHRPCPSPHTLYVFFGKWKVIRALIAVFLMLLTKQRTESRDRCHCRGVQVKSFCWR